MGDKFTAFVSKWAQAIIALLTALVLLHVYSSASRSSEKEIRYAQSIQKMADDIGYIHDSIRNGQLLTEQKR